MNQAEIEAKIVELALLYEQQGADSVAAQKLVEDLAKENAQNIGKVRMSLARKVMLKKVTVKQGKNDVAVDIKSATVSQVMKAIESARSGVAVTQTTKEDKDTIVKNKSNDLSMLGELLSNAEKEQKNQQQTSQAKPTPKKQKPVKKAKAAPAPQVEKDDPQAKPAEVKNKANKIMGTEDSGLPNSLKYNFIRVGDEKPTAEKFESYWQSYDRTHLNSRLGLSGKLGSEGMWCSFATTEDGNIGQWESWCKAQDSYEFYMEEERGLDPQQLMWKYYDFEKENKEFSWHVVPNEDCRILELHSLDDIRPYLRSADGSEIKSSDAEIISAAKAPFSADYIYIDYGAMARDYDLFIMKNDEMGYMISGGSLDVDSAVVFDFNKISVMTNDEYAAFIQKERQVYEEKQYPQSKPAEVKNKIDDKKLESVMKAVDEYIYSRERKAKYAKEIVEAAEQKDVALNVLNHLRTEFTKRSGKDEPKVKRFNLFKLAVAVGAKSFDDEDVRSSLKILLYEISDHCQDDFIRFEANKEDFKDDFVVYLSSVRNENMKSFLHDIYLVHTSELRGKLNEDFRPKYNEWLKRKRKAEEKTAAKDQADTAKKDKTEKDTVSENGNKKDENKGAKGNNPTPIQPKKGDTTMADENNFTPSELQKEACKKAEIEDIGRFKDESSLIAALKEKGYEIKNNEVLPINSSDGNGENNEKAGKEGKTGGKPEEKSGKEDETKAKEGDTGVKEGETDDKDKPMEFNTGPVKEKEPETKEEAPEIAEWVKEKRVEYQKRFENKEIAGYEFDPNEKVGFAAHVEGGYIHYTNKYSVTVSPDSKLKVFEALVTEGHNKGRPVNFGPNLEHKQAVLLFAACVLHGNKIGNGVPKMSQADLDMIKDELAKQGREEDWNNFTAKIKEMTGDKSNENKDNKENKPKAFDEETKKMVKEALEDQYKLSALEDKGADKAVTTDKDGNPIESEYDKLKNKKIKVGDKEVSEKEFLAEKFKENPGEVRAIVKDLINEKTGRKEKEATIADRVEMVRLKSKAKGDDKNADGTKTEGKEAEDKFRANRLQKLQEEMKIALGIKDPEKGLKDKELEKYIKDNNITAYTYGRLGGQDGEVAKKCIVKEGGDAMKDFEAGKVTLKELIRKANENGGK